MLNMFILFICIYAEIHKDEAAQEITPGLCQMGSMSILSPASAGIAVSLKKK